jgi:Abortive infection alpha
MLPNPITMNPDDLIKAAPEIAKGAGALAAAIPFTSIVRRMLGPAADEVAEMWRDQVRVYRFGRQIKLLEKAERMAQEAGFTPQPVPPKILFPLLEGASFEDNESLHTMWAALLANAASPDGADKVKPGFIAALRQMAPDEAALLNRISEGYVGERLLDESTLMETYVSLGFGAEVYTGDRNRQAEESMAFLRKFRACRDSLVAEQLIKKSDDPPEDTKYGLSSRGLGFLSACHPPTKPK